jgi:hypothetical protein
MNVCSTSLFYRANAIFAVQMLFFWCAEQKKFERAVQTFAILWRKFYCLMARVLPPYGLSFAALWREFCRVLMPSTNKQSAAQKSLAFSREGLCV